jgi:Uma2 family endonuclease
MGWRLSNTATSPSRSRKMNVVTNTFTGKYTVEAYLQMEATSAVKHHFIHGEIIPFSETTPIHNLIAGNTLTEVNIELRKKKRDYYVLNSDSPIFIPRLKNVVYPDAVVVCEQIELYPGSTTIITNPLLIVEVLSPSTARYDRTEKFFDYKRIPSFKEYMLMEQSTPLVTTSLKTAEHTWEDAEAEGLEVSIYLSSIDCTIALKNIYRRVKF